MWHVRVISCTPAELLILMRVFNPLEMQRLYKAKKSQSLTMKRLLSQLAAMGSG
jgi:hypothetical protein